MTAGPVEQAQRKSRSSALDEVETQAVQEYRRALRAKRAVMRTATSPMSSAARDRYLEQLGEACRWVAATRAALDEVLEEDA